LLTKRETTFTTDSIDPPWKNTRKELIFYLPVPLPSVVSRKNLAVHIQKKGKNNGPQIIGLDFLKKSSKSK
jgi:hypothetical protein